MEKNEALAMEKTRLKILELNKEIKQRQKQIDKLRKKDITPQSVEKSRKDSSMISKMNDVESTPDSPTGKKIAMPSLSTPQAKKSVPKSLKNSRSVAKISNRASLFTVRPTSGLKLSRNTGVKAKISLPGANPYESNDGDSIMKDGTNPFKTI